MENIFIIHFNPIELYPPVQNLLNYAAKHSGKKLFVLTNKSLNKAHEDFEPASGNIRIIRLAKSGPGMNAISRYLNFILFYVGSFLWLLFKIPSRVMYFETLSSFPAFLYKKIRGKAVSIFVHYHEYSATEEYANGTKLLKFFHRLEKHLYPQVAWLSHTNSYRMEQFVKDIAPVEIPIKKILPNYPPQSWATPARAVIKEPVRIVYVGALSLHTMFTGEFANWVMEQKGKVIWDIYSYNTRQNARDYLSSLNCKFIQLKEGIPYNKLPQTLQHYDVGVVLYTGHILNYVYNAPNKLFEYLACGLDVWFPAVMKGSIPYINTHNYPKVIALDFTKLQELNLPLTLERLNHTENKNNFFCENVLTELGDIFL